LRRVLDSLSPIGRLHLWGAFPGAERGPASVPGLAHERGAGGTVPLPWGSPGRSPGNIQPRPPPQLCNLFLGREGDEFAHACCEFGVVRGNAGGDFVSSPSLGVVERAVGGLEHRLEFDVLTGRGGYSEGCGEV
jgi:hypothetical protein